MARPFRGFLGGIIGLVATIWLGVIGGLFAFVPLLFSSVRHINEMPKPVDDGDAGAHAPMTLDEELAAAGDGDRDTTPLSTPLFRYKPD